MVWRRVLSRVMKSRVVCGADSCGPYGCARYSTVTCAGSCAPRFIFDWCAASYCWQGDSRHVACELALCMPWSLSLSLCVCVSGVCLCTCLAAVASPLPLRRCRPCVRAQKPTIPPHMRTLDAASLVQDWQWFVIVRRVCVTQLSRCVRINPN